MLSWSYDTDPLVKQLYAISKGKLRVYENQVIGYRKLGTDEEILTLFRKEVEAANLRRKDGVYEGGSPGSCLYRVVQTLKQRKVAK